MDESIHGVVFFTLGSMVLIEEFPEDVLAAVYASLANLAPIRVLMKVVHKEKLPPGLPKNVLTMKWIPQVPVLRKKILISIKNVFFQFSILFANFFSSSFRKQ